MRSHFSKKRTLLIVEALEDRLVLDNYSAGPNGIDARNLFAPGNIALTGAGTNIGQVEPTRPGKANGPPNDTAPNFAHTDVTPEAVFNMNNPPVTNGQIDGHAVRVASVMIANPAGGLHAGIAPAARLYASAIVTPLPCAETPFAAQKPTPRAAAAPTASGFCWLTALEPVGCAPKDQSRLRPSLIPSPHCGRG